MRTILLVVALVSIETSAFGQVVFQIPNLLDPRQNGMLQPQFAQPQPLSEAKKRLIVVPFIRGLTTCITDIVNSDDDAISAFRENRFSPYVRGLAARCPTQVADLSARYDRVYGPGTADEFIQGPYANDLPRAVLSRTKDKLQARLDDYDKAQARQRAEREAEQEHQVAIERQRVEDDKAAAEKAEGERKVAEAERAATQAKAAQQKREQLDIANRTFSVLKDKLFECVDGQLPQLVKSGESAEVLASASLTVCHRQLTDAEDAQLETLTIDAGRKPTDTEEENFREKSKSVAKERAIADAVQARAKVGIFAN